MFRIIKNIIGLFKKSKKFRNNPEEFTSNLAYGFFEMFFILWKIILGVIFVGALLMAIIFSIKWLFIIAIIAFIIELILFIVNYFIKKFIRKGSNNIYRKAKDVESNIVERLGKLF